MSLERVTPTGLPGGVQDQQGPDNAGVAVGATTGVIREMNVNRRKLTLVNQSANDVWFAKGPVCTINEGIYRAPYSSLVDEPDTLGYIYRGQWSAISDGAGRLVTICEE